MSLQPLLDVSPVIQTHVSAALVSLVLGPFVIHRRRRDRAHKIMGYVWVLAMTTLAISALFIPSFGFAFYGHFGPIHGFAVLALWSLWQGMAAIFRRDIETHLRALRGLYYQGLMIAGMLNFLPGRAVNRSLFPENPTAGFFVIVAGGAVLAYVAWRQRRPSRRAPAAA